MPKNGVQYELRGDKLHIIVDVSNKAKAAAPVSSSGKNKVVASTHGFAYLDDAQVSVGLNVICK